MPAPPYTPPANDDADMELSQIVAYTPPAYNDADVDFAEFIYDPSRMFLVM